MRRGTMGVLAVARPFLYLSNRIFATRVLQQQCSAERAAIAAIFSAMNFSNIF